jgi:beta-glucosidase
MHAGELQQNVVSPLSRADFGPGFLWGCSTSAFQIEGGAAEGGRVDSIWDTFCRRPGAIRDGATADVACDHYHLWEQDLDLAASLGLTAYRFSIAWPRIYGDGGAQANQAGLDFYSRLVDGMLARGLEPWATLYHWDLPQALQDQGGWASRVTIDAFASYAEHISRCLGDRVKHWITHNEPWCTAFHGNLDGNHAPGIRDLATAIQVTHNVMVSHGRALQAIRANAPGAKAGITLSLHPLRPATDSAADVAACERHDGLRNRWFLDPLYGRGYPEQIVTALGAAAPVVAPGDMALIALPTDFLGVNYYFPEVVADAPGQGALGLRIAEQENVERTAFHWEVNPAGLVTLLERVHAQYQPGSIYLTENGSTYEDVPQADGRVDDVERRSYLQRHLAALLESMHQGVPVKGYFYWSLLDNFEWAEGYTRRFGLAWVDFTTQQRRLKASGEWYQSFLCGS